LITRRQEQIDAVVEMSKVYIEQSETREQIDALGFEIADLKKQVGAVDRDLDGVKSRYLKRRKELA
jgi:hypothetical protein